jgi:hypothetical protein
MQYLGNLFLVPPRITNSKHYAWQGVNWSVTNHANITGCDTFSTVDTCANSMQVSTLERFLSKNKIEFSITLCAGERVTPRVSLILRYHGVAYTRWNLSQRSITVIFTAIQLGQVFNFPRELSQRYANASQPSKEAPTVEKH